ncbi:hypothetical protein F4818DRAFT_419088 [Hypoxylon cercidicola]|nr:hypothetical protein F4818DRAFT_419088 [Hypoxylon cercidicola]
MISEKKVISNVLPIIYDDTDIPNEGNLYFNNLNSITKNTTVDAVPNLFNSTHPVSIDKVVRTNLNKTIIPTNHGQAPVAPNFFLEAKAPKGGADVLRRQACLDGAYGARAMHALQNYGKETPEYDGNAYTFSSTYHAGTGTLAIYSHHITAPPAEGERPEYHMTQLNGYMVTGNKNAYIDGAGALRNTREIAKNFRDKFVSEANTRAAAVGLDVISHGDGDIILRAVNQGDTGESVDCEAPAEPYGTASSRYPDPPVSVPPQLPQYLTEDDAFAPSQIPLPGYEDDPSTSFLTSLSSSLDTDPSRSKRSRQLSSSPSTRRQGQSGKSRVPPNTLERAEDESLPSTSSQQTKAGESFWVETYRRKTRICFKNLQEQEVKTDRETWVEQVLGGGARCFYWHSPKSVRTFWTTKLP